MKNKPIVSLLIVFFVLTFNPSAYAIDTDLTRETIRGLEGINITVEDVQPNIRRYARKAGLTKEQIQKGVEQKLKSAGIKVLTGDEWFTTPGRPMIYININTHEYEKYWYAYDIKLELRQIVFLEANPSVKTMADTWSINMTGIAHIGALNSIRNNAGLIVDRFIEAYRSVNVQKQ